MKLISCLVLKPENKQSQIRLDSLMNEDTVSVHLWGCQLESALFPVHINTTTTVVFTSTHTHDHNKLLAALIGWLLSLSLSFCPILKPVPVLLSQLHWGKQPLRRLEVHRKHWIFALILTVFSTILLRAAWTDSAPLLTSESPVYSLDSPRDHGDPSGLNTAGPGCHSGPVLSDGRGWTSELRPEKNSWSLTNCSSSIWIKNQRCEFRRQSSCLKPQRVKQTK